MRRMFKVVLIIIMFSAGMGITEQSGLSDARELRPDQCPHPIGFCVVTTAGKVERP